MSEAPPLPEIDGKPVEIEALIALLRNRNDPLGVKFSNVAADTIESLQARVGELEAVLAQIPWDGIDKMIKSAWVPSWDKVTLRTIYALREKS